MIVGFLNNKEYQGTDFKKLLHYGPSLKRGAVLAPTGEKDLNDNTKWKNECFQNEETGGKVRGYIGETPLNKLKLYDYLVEQINGINSEKVTQEMLDIVDMHGTPRNAVFGGSMFGTVKVKDKKFGFSIYTDFDDTVDSVLSSVKAL